MLKIFNFYQPDDSMYYGLPHIGLLSLVQSTPQHATYASVPPSDHPICIGLPVICMVNGETGKITCPYDEE